MGSVPHCFFMISARRGPHPPQCAHWGTFPRGEGLFITDVFVNAPGRGLAGAHGEDYGGGAGDRVAAGKDAGTGGHAALIGLNAALLGELQTRGRVADQGVRAGADGDDDGVDFQNPVGVLYRDGLAAALLIGLAQFLADQLDPGDMAFLVAVNGAGVVQQLELDALGLGMLDLFLTGGQLVLAAAVGDEHVLGAEALGDARAFMRFVRVSSSLAL